MRTTKTTVECDKCKATYSLEHWSSQLSSFKVKEPIRFDPQAILGGDYCAACTKSFNDLFFKAYAEWKKD